MKRTPVNPWSWSVGLGFNQAELVEGHRRELVCSGQTAVDADGNPQHPGDMAAQFDLALSNLEAVLAGADMTIANVVRLNVYTPISTPVSNTSPNSPAARSTPAGSPPRCSA